MQIWSEAFDHAHARRSTTDAQIEGRPEYRLVPETNTPSKWFPAYLRLPACRGHAQRPFSNLE